MFIFNQLHHNPVFQADDALFRRSRHRLFTFSKSPLLILFCLGILVTIIPFFAYIQSTDAAVLIGLTIAVYSCQMIITVRTLLLAANSMSNTRQPERWDLLILTSLDARQILLGKWWAVVRYTWKWHVFASVIKIGLALGLAQYVAAINSPNNPSCFAGLHVFCYDMFHADLNFYPMVPKVILGFGILSIYGVFEAFFAAGIGILGGMLGQRLSGSITVLIRIVVLSLFLLLTFYAETRIADLYAKSQSYDTIYLDRLDSYDTAGVLKSLTMAVLVPADGGLVLLANLMKPYQPYLYNFVAVAVTAVTSFLIYGGLIYAGYLLALYLALHEGAFRPRFFIPRIKLSLLINDGLVNAQINAFRRRQSCSSIRHQWMNAVLFLVLGGIASIPLWIYPNEAEIHWLILMIVVTGAVHLWTVVTTLSFSLNSIVRERIELTWDTLLVTGLSNREIVISKWWGIFKAVYMRHLWAGMLKLGLAYAVALYIFVLGDLNDLGVLRQSFFYVSYNPGPCDAACRLLGYPETGKVTLALAAIFLFSVADAALSSALGIWSGLLIHRNGLASFIFALFFRTIPLVMGFAFFFLTAEKVLFAILYQPRPSLGTGDLYSLMRAVESAQVVAVSMIDSGVLASANLLRSSMRVYYILHALVNICLGVGIYGLYTVLALWHSQKLVRRDG